MTTVKELFKEDLRLALKESVETIVNDLVMEEAIDVVAHPIGSGAPKKMTVANMVALERIAKAGNYAQFEIGKTSYTVDPAGKLIEDE